MDKVQKNAVILSVMHHCQNSLEPVGYSVRNMRCHILLVQDTAYIHYIGADYNNDSDQVLHLAPISGKVASVTL
jgi:hypothetical protein